MIKLLMVFILSISINSPVVANEKLNKILDGLDDEENELSQKQEDEFHECMINKIKPISTDAHKSVVKEYCKNKVYKN